MLIGLEDDAVFLTVFNFNRHNFFGQNPVLLGHCSFLLATIGKQILIGTMNLVFFCNVLGGFRHAVDAKLRFKFRVNKAPADGGIKNFRGAAKSGFRFGLDKRCTAHGLNPTGQYKPRFTGLDHTRACGNRI